MNYNIKIKVFCKISLCKKLNNTLKKTQNSIKVKGKSSSFAEYNQQIAQKPTPRAN